ncbi:YlmH family RNA-binding protein [Streptococcus cameli]
MTNEQHILQHFAKDEHIFVEKMLDICKRVDSTYAFELTAFLNPRQIEILQTLAHHFHLQFFSSSAFLKTEYNRVIIAPDYYSLEQEDFEIDILEISYPTKFHRLTHPQILGTLLNQLGIRRELLGDIVMDGDRIFIVVDQKFTTLIQSTITKIARVPVTWKEQDFSILQGIKQDRSTANQLLLSSCRLDKVISAIFRLSRSQAVKLIESGNVKVDYSEVKQTGYQVGLSQLISVRGFGRAKMNELIGYSKQGKLKVEIEIIKN